MKIEEILVTLKENMTIVLVTNLIQQAQRISDTLAFFNDSELVEAEKTTEVFANPQNDLTAKYLSGEMG